MTSAPFAKPDPLARNAPSEADGAAGARSVPQSFGFRLRRLQLAYTRLFTGLCDHPTIPANQIGTLSLIVRNPGITPSELAAILLIEAAQLTPIIKQLEKRGFVRRTPSAADGRSHVLHATDAGSGEYDYLQQAIAEADTAFFANILTAREKQQLFALLGRLEERSGTRRP